MIEWFSWLPNKSSFSNSNISETLKDSPNTPMSLMLLKQRVHELVGVPPSRTTLRKAKDLDQEGSTLFGVSSKTSGMDDSRGPFSYLLR